MIPRFGEREGVELVAIAGITAGDFLLVQFGTNDETHDCPRFVSLDDFQLDLGIMAETVRAKGATPIFVTPMSHRSFVGAAVNNTLLPYANAMKAKAALLGVEVLDLNLSSVEYFESVGNALLAKLRSGAGCETRSLRERFEVRLGPGRCS